MRSRPTIVLVDPICNGEPFKRAATDAGFRVISVVTLPEAVLGELTDPQKLHADTEAVVHAREPEHALAQLRPLAGDSILAVIPATEPGVDMAEELACRLGLLGNHGPVPGARRDKSLMRRCVAAAGLRTPRFRRCSAWPDVERFLGDTAFPLVVKTPRGAGTCQVYVCRDRAELERSFHRCLQRADLFGHRPDFVLLEEFVAGPEFAVNLFAVRGEIGLTDVWAYTKLERSECGPIYLSMVHALSEAALPQRAAVVDYARQVCQAVGIRVGPAHVELKLTPAGPVLIEVAARLCGGRIPELWRGTTDFDPFTSTIAAYLDELSGPPRVTFPRHLGLAFCPLWGVSGTVTGIRGLAPILRLPSYQSHDLNVRVGGEVAPTRDLGSLAAIVRLAHHSPAVVDQDIGLVHRLFQVEACGHQAEHPAR